MAGSAAPPLPPLQPPPPPPNSVQARLHAAWLQHAHAGSAAELDGRGGQPEFQQHSRICRRPAPGTSSSSSSAGGPCARQQPRSRAPRDQPPTTVTRGADRRLPAAIHQSSADVAGQAAALPQWPPAAPAVQLDASDWELLELLRQEAEAAAASSAPAGPACSPPAVRPPAQRLPGQEPRGRQPTSPLARQLAALRSSAARAEVVGAAAEAGSQAQQLSVCAAGATQPQAGGGSGSLSGQTPASPAGGGGAQLAQAVRLLVPQELLEEAEAAATEAPCAAPSLAAVPEPGSESACMPGAAGQGGRHDIVAAARPAAPEQQPACGSREEEGLGPELAAAAEALRQHCVQGRWVATGQARGVEYACPCCPTPCCAAADGLQPTKSCTAHGPALVCSRVQVRGRT